MKNIILIIKGFLIGVSNIVPGVSGGTMMMCLGVFEDIIEKMNNIFTDLKENVKFFAFLGLGAILSILLASRVVTYTLINFTLPTTIFFIGLILGGLPMLYKMVENENKKPQYFMIMLFTFLFVVSITFLREGTSTISLVSMSFHEYLYLLVVGTIAASSMVVPGLSGSFILILLGYYEPIMNAIKEFTSFNDIWNNFIILSVFGVGVLIGLLFIVKIINHLLNFHKTGTIYAILGFVLASIISIIKNLFVTGFIITTGQVIFSLVLLILGITVSYRLGEQN